MRNWLKNLREIKGFTQQNVAEKLDIAQQYYSCIENGERQKDLSLSLIVKIAEIFGVTIEWIVEQEQKEQR